MDSSLSSLPSAFLNGLEFNIIASDTDCIITYMNQAALRNYEKDGGAALIGRNLLDCHNGHSRDIIRHILATGEKNVYTSEKSGKKKLIYQAPWYGEEGAMQGIVELSMEIPFDMPHYVRS